MLVVSRRLDDAGRPILVLYERDDGELLLQSAPYPDETSADLALGVLYEDLMDGAVLIHARWAGED